MAIIRSDNRAEFHPKPVQEYERRFTGVTWVDWVSFSEMEAVYNVAYRLNKYFWVDGKYYQCYGTSLYREIGGGGTGNSSIVDVVVEEDSQIIDVPELEGKTFFLAIQGATPYNRTYITQDGTELDFSGVGGTFTGQRITIFYQ